ncbi:MAG: ATPase, T2SS/T4P/T4SS family [Eggerthella lenta]
MYDDPLNTDSVNLVPRSPVEYNIDGVNQVQINEKTGMTFASGLRAILRQDPDIVAVGEFATVDGRDRHARRHHRPPGAVTVHTYDAASTIDRLIDIGVGIPHRQRRARRHLAAPRAQVCPHCRGVSAQPEEFGVSAAIRSGVRFADQAARCASAQATRRVQSW